ncbi:hypothetical protein FM120_15680 [Sphingobacterium faecium PCAi_F2.5]|nr:hypothetical protein FM120_15680 [Sphingobacterium faecium PCAi_F2.5]
MICQLAYMSKRKSSTFPILFVFLETYLMPLLEFNDENYLK